MERDNSISFLRVLAMLMIILCHLSIYFDLWIAQIFNAGVYVFLLISGYLYSNKAIAPASKWFFHRWIKICVPVLIFVVLVVIYEAAIMNDFPSGKDLILFGLNLQGLHWIIPYIPGVDEAGALGGLTHLWFITVIMICYLMLIAIKRIENKTSINNKIVIPVILLVFILLGLLRVNVLPLACFYIGYVSGKNSSIISKKNYLFLTTGMIIALAARFVIRRFADDTALYDVVTVHLSHLVLALWIFHAVRLITVHIKLVSNIAQSKFVFWCDQASLFIYITHDYFLSEQFGLKDLVYRTPAQVLLFFALSIITAIGLKFLCELNSKKTPALIKK